MKCQVNQVKPVPGQRRIVSGVISSRSPGRRALGIRLSRLAISARPPRSGSGGVVAASAVRRADGAGSGFLRSSRSPHAETAAARRPPAWSGERRAAGT
jgi:hypothetical protein